MHGFLLKCSCCSKSKISNFNFIVLSKKNICRFQISMNDLFWMNVSQPLQNTSDYLNFDLIFFESRSYELFEIYSPHEFHDNVQYFERKIRLLFLLRFLRILLRYFGKRLFCIWIDRHRFTRFLKLNFAVSLKVNIIILLKHNVIVILVLKQFGLFAFGLILKNNSPFWFSPVLINVLQLLFFLRLGYRHVMNKFVKTADIL